MAGLRRDSNLRFRGPDPLTGAMAQTIETSICAPINAGVKWGSTGCSAAPKYGGRALPLVDRIRGTRGVAHPVFVGCARKPRPHSEPLAIESSLRRIEGAQPGLP
jgi:hypothetical protein